MPFRRSIANPVILDALTTRLGRLTPDRARRWGSITAHQMAAHVGDAAEPVLRRATFAPSPRRPSPLIRIVALYLPLRWPPGLQGGADPAARQLDPAAFDHDRQRAIANLRELATATDLLEGHPAFGPMSRSEWHRWAFLHTDHHLRQFGL